MPDPDTISISPALLPADGRFGSGPSKVRQEAVDRLAAIAPRLLGTSHRKAPVKDQVRRLRAGLRDLFAVPDGHEVALGVGGATLFWDAAAFSLIRRRSAHAVLGEFSSKFADVTRAAPFLDEPVVVTAEPGTRPDVRLLAEGGADAWCLPHCETSTGVVVDPIRPAGTGADGLLLVDATSGAGGLPVDLAQVDAYYFSPQKAFASEGGLWVAVLSPAAVARLDEIRATGRHVPAVLDLRQALENSRQEQTLNTPAISTLFLMAEQVDWINEQGGLAWAVKSCAAKSQAVYEWADARAWAAPFVADAAARSAVVCTVDLDDVVPADAVTSVLRRHGVVDIDAYRKLGRNQLRIAVFPAVEQSDVEALLACIDHVAERLSG